MRKRLNFKESWFNICSSLSYCWPREGFSSNVFLVFVPYLPDTSVRIVIGRQKQFSASDWLRTGGALFLWSYAQCLVSQGQIWRVSSKLILLDLSSDMVSSKLILMNLSYFSFPLSFSCVLPSDCLCWAEVSEAVSDTSEQCPPNSLPSNSFLGRFTVKTFHWKFTRWKFVAIWRMGENHLWTISSKFTPFKFFPRRVHCENFSLRIYTMEICGNFRMGWKSVWPALSVSLSVNT